MWNGHSRCRAKPSDLEVSIDIEEEDEGEGEEEEEEEETGEHAVKDNIRNAIINFVETDIEEAAEKYDLKEELFAEIDFAQVFLFFVLW